MNELKKNIVLIALLPLVMVINSCGGNKTQIVISTPASAATSTALVPASGPVRIYLTGCVREPGVYQLPAHSIVDDFLTAAGGPTHKAWLDAINLAREPQHEEHVTIPCLPTPATAITTSPSLAGGNCQPDQVRINTASAVELESLPGIGPSLAQRIMAHIAANGPFQTVEDLQDVPGIGPTSLENLRPHVCVE